MQNDFPIACRRENQWLLINPNFQNNNVLRLETEFEKYWRKIERGENFAFARYADGELALMLGKKIKAVDGWTTEADISSLGKALKESLGFSTPNFIYGISCPCCDSESYYWYLRHLKNCNISFSNIWVNANFAQFKEKFLKLERDAILITNYRGRGKSYGKLNIKKHYFTTNDDSIKFWENDAAKLIQQIIDETGDERDMLYVVSAGPMSALIIKALFENNPHNCYIDFGSAIDFITHGKITRPYMIETTPYAKQKCWMFDNKSMSVDVDVVLSAYRRPEILEQQLDAVKNQTLKPARIFLYQDAVKSGDKIVIASDTLKKFDAYCIAKENGGVWKRFEYAAEMAMSPYICIFDDDTIPGRRWLENCHMHFMANGGGIYGTNGIILQNINYPDARNYFNVGWHTSNENAQEVDFVGHAWFVAREYLKWMVDKTYGAEFKYVGEDMCISFAAQERGVKTYVPPHPREILSLWGSIPKYGWQYGTSEVALSLNPENSSAMSRALIKMHADGWKLLFERAAYYVKFLAEQRRTAALLQSIKMFLPLIDKGRAIFFGENKYSALAQSSFNLQNGEYIVLEDSAGKITFERVIRLFKKNSVHIFFTDVYEQMKPYLQRLNLIENADFIDGRRFLIIG